MIKAKHIVTILALILSQQAFSQDGEYIVVRDLEAWSSVNLSYKIDDLWKINLEEQFRFDNNASQIESFFTELSAKYEFTDQIYGNIGYRFIRNNDTEGNIQGYENHGRIHLDLGYKNEIQRFKIESRLRFQSRNELGVSTSEGDYAKNHLRFKAGLGYNIKKWKLDPVLSAEIFRLYEKQERNGFDKFRFTAETQYKLKAYGKIGLFYRMERELYASYPKTTNIIGFKYTYTLQN